MIRHYDQLAAAESLLKIFHTIASELERKRNAIIKMLVQIETLQMAQLEINKSIRALRTYSREMPYLMSREPVGKVGVILPFNTPLYGLILYCFGPLLSGNRVFAKPSSFSYEVTKAIYDCCIRSHLGEILTLHEPGRWFLSQLCLEQEKVQVLSFTGRWDSVEPILGFIPDNVRVIYSGSGYNPFLVLSNADLVGAARTAIISRLWNSGQDCLATERFYIEDEVYDEFVDILLELVSTVRCGENTQSDVLVGPLVSDAAVEHVQSLFKNAGASVRLLHAGKIQDRLITPFVFEAFPNSVLTLSEKYAPVFVVVKCENRDALLYHANETAFALGATVFGDDDFLIPRLAAAHVAHNSSVLEIEDEDAHVPFGGYRNSGFVRHKATNHYSAGPILYSVETSVPSTMI